MSTGLSIAERRERMGKREPEGEEKTRPSPTEDAIRGAEAKQDLAKAREKLADERKKLADEREDLEEGWGDLGEAIEQSEELTPREVASPVIREVSPQTVEDPEAEGANFFARIPQGVKAVIGIAALVGVAFFFYTQLGRKQNPGEGGAKIEEKKEEPPPDLAAQYVL